MTNHPNRAVLYTVLSRHGDVRGDGLTLSEAADVVLSYDGHEYEIRPVDGGFDLWVSKYSRNSTAWSGLTKSIFYSIATDEDLAAAEIYREVMLRADMFYGQSVMTDADYAAMLADLEEQNRDQD